MRYEEESSEEEAIEISIKQPHSNSQTRTVEVHKKISKPKVQRQNNKATTRTNKGDIIEDQKLLRELENKPVDLGPAPTKAVIIQDPPKRTKQLEGLGAQVVRVIKKDRRHAPDPRMALLEKSQHLRKSVQNIRLLKRRQQK